MRPENNNPAKLVISQIERSIHVVQTYEMRLTALINEYVTDVNNIFTDFNPFQLEDIAVPIVTLFNRHSLLLAVYDSVRVAGVNLYEKDFSDSDREIISRQREVVDNSRKTYVDAVGRRVLAAFNERLLRESRADGCIDDIETLLLAFFGTAYPSEIRPSGNLKLRRLLQQIGEIVRRPVEAQKLCLAVGMFPSKEHVTAPREIDKKEIEHLLTTIEVKYTQLKKSLENQINETTLGAKLGSKGMRAFMSGYLESVLVPIQTNFCRASLLLNCFEAELKFIAQERSLPAMSKSIKNRYAAILDDIWLIRKHYVEDFGGSLLRKILETVRFDMTGEKEPLSVVDNLLITWFGTGMPTPGDTNCPAFKELMDLLSILGRLTGLQEQAEKLSNCLKTTARLEARKLLN